MNFGSMRVESHFHNPYSMDIYRMSSGSNSWVPSQIQPSESNSYVYSQPIMQNPYNWHINNCMQNYQENTSFHNYFLHFTSQN